MDLNFLSNDVSVPLDDYEIAVYKKIKNHDLFAPYNRTALNYEIATLDHFYEEKFNSVKFQFLDESEKNRIHTRHVLLKYNFKKIKTKNKGTVKLSDNILAYDISNNYLKPVSSSSKENLYILSKLRDHSVDYYSSVWNSLI